MNKIKLTHDEYNDTVEAAEKQGERRLWCRIKNAIRHAVLIAFIVLLFVLVVLAILYLWRVLFG